MAISFPSPKLIGIPFLKNRDVLAIDVGSAVVKIIHLKVSGGKYSLAKWGILPVSDGTTELSPQDRKSLIASRIGEFLAKEKITIKNVVSSVSGNQVIVRYVKFPKLSYDDLNKSIQIEAEPYIPFDIREVNLSFHPLNDVIEDGQKKMETILVAAKKEIVQNRLDIFDELLMRPVVIDIDAFALINAYEISSSNIESETAVLINIGANATNIAIVENHVPRVVRDVFISGNSFTKTIQRNLSCDVKTAEDLKSRYNLLVTAEEKEKTLAENQKEALQVSTAMAPIAKDLLAEIHRSIDFYIAQNPDRNINRVLITGGSANLKNLDKYLGQELKLPVEIFNPLKNIPGGELVPDNFALYLSIAVGLGTRYENDIPK